MPTDDWLVIALRAIHPDHVGAQQVDVPHDLGAGGEVIGSFAAHRFDGGRAVIVLTPHLGCEVGRAFEELHAGRRAGVPRSVGAERLAVR
jgi:hypothetical protein